MLAIKDVPLLPFGVVTKGLQVEVAPAESILGVPMNTLIVNTNMGLMHVHLPESIIKDGFKDVTPSDSNEDLAWLENLFKKLEATTTAQPKPHIKVVNPTQFFVLDTISDDTFGGKVGDVVTVVGTGIDGRVLVRDSQDRTQTFAKEFYNHVVHYTEQPVKTNLNKMKMNHYRKQGFVSSGGILSKKIDDKQTQIVKEDNLDIVRVLIDNQLQQIIAVTWPGIN